MEGAQQPAEQRRFVAPPGYTQIPHELLDEVMPLAGLAELKVTLAIARQTFGWGVTERLLSLTDLQQLTGLSRQSAQNGVEAGMERGFIGRRRDGRRGFIYGLRVKNLGNVDPGIESTSLTSSSLDSRPTTSKGKKTLRGKDKLPGIDDADPAKQEDPVEAVIEECFEAWRTGVGKNGGSKLDARRRSKIRKRLEGAAGESPDQSGKGRLAYAREEVLTAVAGMVNSDWHRREGHTNFDQLFRDDGCIEKFAQRRRAQLAQAPAAAPDDTYRTTKRNPELEQEDDAP